MTDSPSKLHKQDAPQSIACAVITVSDTRTFETDTGGQMILDRLQSAGLESAEDLIADLKQALDKL